MSNQKLKRLFKPGTGAVPPYLAGRKREQEYFQDCVEALKDREPLSQDMILYGPRGNGKTALLRYLQQETLQQEKPKLEIMWVKPFELETQAGLENLIMGNDRKSWDKVKTAGLSAHIGIAGASAELDFSRSAVNLMNLLRSKSQIKPLILIIDEAHTLKPEVGKVLLNTSQDLRSEGHPFLLALAGTPNLKATLGKANASFWDRSKKFPLGRLSPEEARQAITVPLEKAGISFAPGVAEEIVERTHRYPFFTQVWGNYLAERLDQTGERVISIDTVKEAEAEAINECKSMYQDRFNEIKKMGLLAVAESVAHVFIQNGETYLHGRVLEQAIERGMAGDEPITNERIMENIEQLSHLGYIWQAIHPDGWYDYEPGIPSLMSFVHGYSLAQTKGEVVRSAEPGDAPSLDDRVTKLRKGLAKDQDTGMEL